MANELVSLNNRHFALRDAHMPNFVSPLLKYLLQKVAISGNLTKSQLFAHLEQGSRAVESVRNELNRVLYAAHTGAGFDPEPMLPAGSMAIGNGFDLARQPVAEVKHSIEKALAQFVTNLLTDFNTTLYKKALRFEVGLVNRAPEDLTVFQFYFPRFYRKNSHIREATGIRHTGWAELEGHVHVVVDGLLTPISQNKTYLPSRVRPIADAMPPYLDAHVLTGQMIHEIVAKKIIDKESSFEPFPPPPAPVYYRDPAIVLGNYVLAGWLQDEADKDRGEEQKERKAIQRHQNQDKQWAENRISALLSEVKAHDKVGFWRTTVCMCGVCNKKRDEIRRLGGDPNAS